jgi:glutamate formiminotransferase / formiminotetrahydrofolate cyclodeaminase
MFQQNRNKPLHPKNDKLMESRKLLECVPNFSEGRNMEIIHHITAEIKAVKDVDLLDTDSGKDTNRTVVTFVGPPDEVVTAAFRAVKKASQLIDMRQHIGEHPRFGATDVCPLVPVSGLTMDDAVEYARLLARRIGNELQIPVYCYEYAAFKEERKNLANSRAVEYEGLKEKLSDPQWKPDFGPDAFNARSGATAVGARDFLVAYNINLNTTSIRKANAVAFDIREKGRIKTDRLKPGSQPLSDEDSNPVRIPGSLKAVKGMGWYLEEFGMAQVSLNLTNLNITPVHKAFEEACKKAESRGLRVTGSELVGLIPLEAMLDAGRYFLKKQKKSAGAPEKELIKIAIRSLGLNDLYPFSPENKIIEYKLARKKFNKWGNTTLFDFLDKTASDSVKPGGGPVTAYLGALGAALGTMVANVSANNNEGEDQREALSNWAEKGIALQTELTRLMDEDGEAYQQIIRAQKMPQQTADEKEKRKMAIREAFKNATRVPYKIMKTAYKSIEVISATVDRGIPNALPDAGVGAFAAVAAVKGAFLNIQSNTRIIDDQSFVKDMLTKGNALRKRTEAIEQNIIEIIKNRRSELQ